MLRYKLVIFLFSLQLTYSQRVLSYEVHDGPNYATAAFSLWISDSTLSPEGILVLVPGSNGDGRGDISDTVWQAFAEETNLAIIGCFLKDKPHDIPAIEHYVNVKNGTGDALLEAIKYFAGKTDIPALEALPLLLFGVSAGGEFNYEFACWRPDRVLAFVVNKGGVYYTAIAPAAAWEVPGLFITGEKDIPYRTNIVKGIFSINRRFGAKWAYAHDPLNGHNSGESPSLSRSFFREVLNERKQLEKGNAVGIVGLNAQEILSETNPGDTVLTSWIINEAFGQSWLDFISE